MKNKAPHLLTAIHHFNRRYWRVLAACAVLLCGVGLAMGLLWLIFSDDGTPTRPRFDTTPRPPRATVAPYVGLPLVALDFSPDGRYIVAKQGIIAPQMVVLNRADRTPVGTVTDVGFDLPFAFAPDATAVYYTDIHSAETLMRYDIETGAVTVVLQNLDGLRSFAAAPNGHYIAVTARGRAIDVYALNDVENPRRVYVRGQITGLHFAPDSQTLAVELAQGVALWSLTGTVAQHNLNFGAHVAASAFAEGGSALWVALMDGELLRVDVRTGTTATASLRAPATVTDMTVHEGKVALVVRHKIGLHAEVLHWQWMVVENGHPIFAEHNRTPLLGGAYQIAFAPDGALYILPRLYPSATEPAPIILPP